MRREDFSFTSDDGLEIAYFRWRATATLGRTCRLPTAWVSTLCAMSTSPSSSTRPGFHVYANDHRGHGQHRARQGIARRVRRRRMERAGRGHVALSNIVRTRDTGFPLILLGHSMGSFAAQHYLLDHSDLLAGAALSGSAAVDKLADRSDRGRRTLTAFNRGFEPARTQHDWLSRDPAAVDAYEADPLCGFGVNKPAMATMVASAIRA